MTRLAGLFIDSSNIQVYHSNRAVVFDRNGLFMNASFYDNTIYRAFRGASNSIYGLCGISPGHYRIIGPFPDFNFNFNTSSEIMQGMCEEPVSGDLLIIKYYYGGFSPFSTILRYSHGIENGSHILPQYISSAITGSVGTYIFKGGSPNAIQRLKPGGAIDSTYGINGSVELTTVRSNFAIVTPEEKLIICSGGQRKITRLNADGSIDMSFGIDGIATIPDGSNIYLKHIFIHGDHLYIVSNLGSVIRFCRFSKDGILDTTFAKRGQFDFHHSTGGIAKSSLLVPDGDKLILVINCEMPPDHTYRNFMYRLKEGMALVGIESIVKKEAECYPNPANDKLTIRLPESGDIASIHIFSPQGGIVYSMRGNHSLNAIDSTTIDLPHTLSNGIYTMKIIVSNTIYTSRFVISR